MFMGKMPMPPDWPSRWIGTIRKMRPLQHASPAFACHDVQLVGGSSFRIESALRRAYRKGVIPISPFHARNSRMSSLKNGALLMVAAIVSAAVHCDAAATDKLRAAADPVIASTSETVPAIHGPRMVGTTPGRPFLFLIPATGETPLEYAADALPPNLALDATSGIITGAVLTTGTYEARLTVKGPRGTAARKLSIVAGDHKLALTPPMGWNSWNCWGTSVDDAKVRAAADCMVRGGLAAHGYQYVNIDDGWQKGRDADGTIQPNEKFPDMRALADYVHARGLKLGIYSSPGRRTCGGYEGSYQHEDQDAATCARWGIDYLKYDWCSYGEVAADGSVEEIQKPYRVMRASLDRCGRDIVYSLCQYGMAAVWKWGAETGGNLWRTTGDIGDSWDSIASIGFAHDEISSYSQPGHWNDPDMLVVGHIGWGPNLHPTTLTKHEQVTHMTLWCLLAAPLLVGCDLSRLDSFTVDLLTNDEVLDVDQDPLGKAATRRAVRGDTEVWARALWDGTIAAGLFNRGGSDTTVTVSWADLGLTGRHRVRNLWQRKDVGDLDGAFEMPVGHHGAALIRIGVPAKTD
jgi:alpha-galactosidase